MPTGAITSNIDVAQLVLYAFWIFFAGLIIYLRREDKREGYPLESDRAGHVPVVGFPKPPRPKVFNLPHGGTYEAPNDQVDDRPVAAEPVGPWPGAPLQQTGDAMADGVGAAAYAQRADSPELTVRGEPKIVPLRVATDFSVAGRDPDPRGMPVYGADNREGGRVTDVWVDQSEPQIRYLEVEVAGGDDTAAGGSAAADGAEAAPGTTGGAAAARPVLLPITFARVSGRDRRVRVTSICARHFAGVPVTAQPDRVTLQEEDRITAYYGGGHLYAMPQRTEPVL